VSDGKATEKRYLVTGGAGFIGSHITEALLRAGHRVTVLDDLSSGRPENLKDVLAGDREATLAARFRFIEGSILDDTAVDEAIGGATAVFHQAAIPSVPRSFADPAATLRANVEGTSRVLEACQRHGVQRFVFASSSSVYGDTPTLPKHEEMPPCPMSPYALSKLAGEHLCDIYARQYGITTVAMRYFNVFGPRQDPTSQYAAVVPNFICRLLEDDSPVVYGDGGQSRDFTYVENVVTANLLAAGMSPTGAEVSGERSGATDTAIDGSLVVNVGAGGRHTLLRLIEALNEILGKQIPPTFTDPRPGDVRHSHAAVEKAGRYLGYEPAVGFEEGLDRTVAWFRQRAEQPRSRECDPVPA
jgi:UDP-glucose 4-epimerase